MRAGGRYAAAFVGLFALLLGFNAPHLGDRAAMQWDTRTCLCTDDPMPTTGELADARRHLFDLAPPTADPAAATAAFVSPAGLGRHGPLETVRRYYSQPAYWVARSAMRLGERWTGTFAGGVVVFQLTALAMVSAAVAGLGRPLPSPSATDRLLVCLAFAAVATEPVFLSVARQVMTETVGFTLLVPTLLAARTAVGARSRPAAVTFAAAAGAGLFAVVRSRYTLGPAAVLLVPVVVSEVRRVWLPLAAAAAAFAAGVAIDVGRYGPFVLPWVYDRTLVRTTRLYFHADPPYDAFWSALYLNGPLIGLPVLGFVLAVVNRRNVRPFGPPLKRLGIAYAVAAVMLVQTGRQQVSYQPRHLFAPSAVFAVGLLVTVGRVRWRRATAVPLAVACGAVLLANAYSTLRTPLATGDDRFPRSVAQVLRARTAEPMWAVLAGGYVDPSEDRRVYDLARVLGQAGQMRALLVIDAGAEAAGWYPPLATSVCVRTAWGAATADVTGALAAGEPVLVVGPPRGLPAVAGRFRVVPVNLPLDRSALFRVYPPMKLAG